MFYKTVFWVSVISLASAEKNLRINLSRRPNEDFKNVWNQNSNLKENIPTVEMMKHIYEYFGSISVGTPGQFFNVTFSTARISVIIPDALIKGSCGAPNHHEFNSTNSSTFFSTGDIIQYNKPYDTVLLAKDVVKVGDYSVSNITLSLIQKGDCPNGRLSDGELGLGFDANTTSVLSQLVQEKKVSKNIISLRMESDLSKDKGGEIIFGGYEENKVEASSLKYIDIEREYETIWQIPVQNVSIGKNIIGKNTSAIIDSSMSFLGVPTGQMDIIKNVTGATLHNNLLLVDPSQVDKMPEISFSISNITYTLKAKEYVDTAHSSFNLSLILINPTEDDSFVLGGVFLSKYITILDYDNKKVAFATMKQDQNSGTTSKQFWLLTPLVVIILKMFW